MLYIQARQKAVNVLKPTLINDQNRKNKEEYFVHFVTIKEVTS